MNIQKNSPLVFGILAHVDAGKTTLAESLLYLSGSIRKAGRVDHQDAFLDHNELERKRGITIFSKQAELNLDGQSMTLLDTPGHVDFSAEMERTLQVLDYAILVISGADGVQGHVLTLWHLLKRYQIPVFLFINKMDQPGTSRSQLLAQLQRELSEHCIDFSDTASSLTAPGFSAFSEESFCEAAAMCDEGLLEQYLEQGSIRPEQLLPLIRSRQIFPCYFGSALKMTGVTEFLSGLSHFTYSESYPETFGARIFKIARDEQNNRLTYMKITGGSLKCRMPVTDSLEKADQIRIYSGQSFRTVKEAFPGMICAVTGLIDTKSGEVLGDGTRSLPPELIPVLTYQLILPEGCNVHDTFLKLLVLEEEDPELHIVWKEALGEIQVQVMGDVQIEILTALIRSRFGIEVSFGTGNIVYKETIETPVEGVGHFEPLRHYAEVHLKLEPGPRGSGLQCFSSCSEDHLDRNWQRLILTHLEETIHPGVLAGSEITDMVITLTAGRAHIKHTEGGDFRQATYRAVRQGLRKAKSVLLEPFYEFRLDIPGENLGRALSDIQKMSGTFSDPILESGRALLTGSAPVSTMRDYQKEVAAYTHGTGRLTCSIKGYDRCHNTEEVLASLPYDPDSDLEHPCGSVFCAHGAGFVVPWDQVEQYMHLEETVDSSEAVEADHTSEAGGNREASKTTGTATGGSSRSQKASSSFWAGDKELEEIFTRTYGSSKQSRTGASPSLFDPQRKTASTSGITSEAILKKAETGTDSEPIDAPPTEYLLVDGYNVIFAWEELKDLAKTTLEGARSRLMDILCNYQGYRKVHLTVVFDGYRVKDNPGEEFDYHNIHVVYTKHGQTADQYIEKLVHEMAKGSQVTVATSDALEQVIVYGQGARRLSSKGLLEEIARTSTEIRDGYLDRQHPRNPALINHLKDQAADVLKELQADTKKTSDSETTGQGDANS